MDAEELKKRGLIFTGRHLPYNPLLVKRAKELRKNMTLAEKKLWYGFLQQFQYHVHTQHPIDNYIVDFYCASLKLIIEIDGEQHSMEEGKIYDAERDYILESYGLRIVRVKNNEVFDNFNAVCRKIKQFALK